MFTNEQKKVIFSTCHELTKALVKNTHYNYHVTFSGCLKLYFSDSRLFSLVLAQNNVINDSFIKLSDSDFDFYNFAQFADSDKKSYNDMMKCVNFALHYGLKQRDKFRTSLDIINDSISDNNYPIMVDFIRREYREDIKNDIVVFLYDRINDSDFLALPNIYKLIRAGDAVTQNYIRKAQKHNNKNMVSFDDLMQSGKFEPSTEQLEFCENEIEALIDSIVSMIPKIHRATAKEIIYSRYIQVSKNGIEIKGKIKNLDTIASELNISLRKVKQIISEIKNVNVNRIAF